MSVVRQLVIATRALLVALVVLGFAYPLVVWGAGNILFNHQANGSLVVRDGKVVGSRLIGQHFDGREYFRGRPSAAGDAAKGGYDAMASGSSNLGPTSAKLAEQVKARLAAYRAENPGRDLLVPTDAAYASGSGLDPDISEAYANAQVDRVAQARGLTRETVVKLIAASTTGRDLGFLGEPRVNVLALNLALDSAARGANGKP